MRRAKSIDTPSKILFGRRRLAGLAGIGQARAERRFYGRSRHSSEGVSTRRSCYGNATCLLALLARANWPPRVTNDLNSASPPETTSTYSSLPPRQMDIALPAVVKGGVLGTAGRSTTCGASLPASTSTTYNVAGSLHCAIGRQRRHAPENR